MFFFKKKKRERKKKKKKLHIFPASYPTPFQKPVVRVTTAVLTHLGSHHTVITDLWGNLKLCCSVASNGIMLILRFIKLVKQQVPKLKNGPI